MLRGFVLYLVGACGLISVGATVYGQFRAIPLIIWVPLFCMTACLCVLLSLLFFMWSDDWNNKRLNTAGDYVLKALFVCMSLTILAVVAVAGPL